VKELINQLRCALRGRHDPTYRVRLSNRVIDIEPRHLDSMRDETANPHDRHVLCSGEIGNFFGIPIRKACRLCGKDTP
jgi:hypothetical protein